MNVFLLDESPQVAATYLCNSHLVKMQLESAQLLSTLARYLVGNNQHICRELYQPTHYNHPCNKHLRASKQYCHWVYDNAIAMAVEKHRRDGKRYHASYHVTQAAWQVIVEYGFWPFKQIIGNVLSWPLAMNPAILAENQELLAFIDGYHVAGLQQAVLMYREYYRRDKQHLLKYTNAQTPDWL